MFDRQQYAEYRFDGILTGLLDFKAHTNSICGHTSSKDQSSSINDPQPLPIVCPNIDCEIGWLKTNRS